MNDDVMSGLMMVIICALSLTSWVVTGWWLWGLIGVDGFGDGIMWFMAWGFVGGIAQALVVPLLSTAILAVASALFKPKN